MKKALAIAGLAAAITLAGCGSPSEDVTSTGSPTAGSPAPAGECGTGEDVTIKWQNWISQEEGSKAFSEQAVAAFEAKCPNINIEVVGVPAEKTNDQMVLAASSGQGPDVFQTQTFMTAQFTDLGLFAPLTTLDDVKSGMLPSAVTAGTYEDQWTNATWGLAPLLLTYNKNVLKAAGLAEDTVPKTWDEMFQLTQQIGSKGSGSTFGYCQDSGKGYLNGFWTLNMLFSYGAEFYKDGKANIDSPEIRAAFTDYQKWYNTPGSWAQGIDVRQCRDLFATDKVAYNFESSWARGIYRAQSGQGEAFDSQWGVASVPAGPSGKGVAADANQGLAVAKYSQHPAEAEAFIRFMITDPDITAAYLQAVGFPTPYQSLWTGPAYEDPLVTALIEAAPNSKGLVSAKYNELAAALGEALQRVANGESVDTVIADLQGVFEANAS